MASRLVEGGRSLGFPLILLRALALLAVALSLPAPGAAAAVSPTPSPKGLVFHVGGPRGWRVPDATTNYGWWATNNRFHVGDELYFKYATNDSVLLVHRAAFDDCNATDPVAAFANGATTFRLDRPGFFCFISGEPGHCDDGQRLVVRVMVHPAAAAAPGPAEGPDAAGHGGAAGGDSGRPRGSGPPGASSGSAAEVAAAAGVAVAAVAVALVSLVLVFQ